MYLEILKVKMTVKRVEKHHLIIFFFTTHVAHYHCLLHYEEFHRKMGYIHFGQF